jgi:hypothetical protein
MKGLGIRSNGFHVFLSDFFFESASAKAVRRHLLHTTLRVVCSSALLWLRIITRGLSLTISVLEFQCVLDFRCFLGPVNRQVVYSSSVHQWLNTRWRTYSARNLRRSLHHTCQRDRLRSLTCHVRWYQYMIFQNSPKHFRKISIWLEKGMNSEQFGVKNFRHSSTLNQPIAKLIPSQEITKGPFQHLVPRMSEE